MAEYLFNVDHGYLEGLVRGFRSGILSRVDYLNLVQCETVDGELHDLDVHDFLLSVLTWYLMCSLLKILLFLT